MAAHTDFDNMLQMTETVLESILASLADGCTGAAMHRCQQGLKGIEIVKHFRKKQRELEEIVATLEKFQEVTKQKSTPESNELECFLREKVW